MFTYWQNNRFCNAICSYIKVKSEILNLSKIFVDYGLKQKAHFAQFWKTSMIWPKTLCKWNYIKKTIVCIFYATNKAKIKYCTSFTVYIVHYKSPLNEVHFHLK